MDIKGSVALVTGANRGIGEAFVEALLAGGASRIYATARDRNNLTDLVGKDPERVVPLVLDVTKPEQVKEAAKRAAEVTLLVNNAGAAQFTSFLGPDNLDAARVEMETNYFGTLSVTRAFAPVLKANGGGAIVTVASIASHVNFPILGSYSASKAAAHSLTQGVRAELRGQGTLVVGVYPGPVETRMAKDFPAEKVPPSQIAAAALAAVQGGVEDVYPDATAEGLYQSIQADPKAAERQVAEMAPAG